MSPTKIPTMYPSHVCCVSLGYHLPQSQLGFQSYLRPHPLDLCNHHYCACSRGSQQLVAILHSHLHLRLTVSLWNCLHAFAFTSTKALSRANAIIDVSEHLVSNTDITDTLSNLLALTTLPQKPSNCREHSGHIPRSLCSAQLKCLCMCCIHIILKLDGM
jgi:hypothetical protein